jgi:hypothetical protein
MILLFTKGIVYSIIFSAIMTAILIIFKRIWLPPTGKLKIRIYSLYILLAVCSPLVIKDSITDLISGFLIESIKLVYPNFHIEPYSSFPQPVYAVSIVLIGIFIINYFSRDTTAMGEHSKEISGEFGQKEYSKILSSFCEILHDDLKKLDRETNWSMNYFTPLEAEVEVQIGNRKKKRITDLFSAIKSNKKNKVFLVLGDPGSGKSVSLRKLCMDLLKEVKKTGKVPIYINLKEWENQVVWSEDNPPTVLQLYDFVISSLKERGDVFFIDKYFKQMFDNGRIFFILDSFDEIPAVLDVDESSWLIHRLSDVIYKFLAGAHESRGILSSRLYRKPTHEFSAKTTLEIRPFSETKIIESLKKSLHFEQQLVSNLFSSRKELIPIARNPFSSALISNYARENDNKLPENKSDLYSNYI